MMSLTTAQDRPTALLEFVYVAVGKQNTKLFRFNPTAGSFDAVRDPEGKEIVYAPGYDSMGYRAADGKLYAMRNDDKRTMLVVIDPKSGKISDHEVDGLNNPASEWFMGAFDSDGNTLMVAAGPSEPIMLIDVTANPPKVTGTQHPSGSGRFDDWSFHPTDRRLYAIEGDNGDLLYMDAARNPQKVVLKPAAFPKAQSSASGGRTAYAATFFDEEGRLYGVDSKGNVHIVDLTASTAQNPVDASRIGAHKQVGNGRVDVGGHEVRDAAGRIKKIKIGPSYDKIRITYTKLRGWEQAPGRTYSYRLTIEATDSDVHQFRIIFDLPAGGNVVASGIVIKLHEGGKVYLEPQQGQLLRKGEHRDIDVQVTVPGANLPKERDLTGLQAVRLTSIMA